MSWLCLFLTAALKANYKQSLIQVASVDYNDTILIKLNTAHIKDPLCVVPSFSVSSKKGKSMSQVLSKGVYIFLYLLISSSAKCTQDKQSTQNKVGDFTKKDIDFFILALSNT